MEPSIKPALSPSNDSAQTLEPRLDTLLPLVALGTVADVVKLDANNRRLVAQGLKRIRSGHLPAGLASLFTAAGRKANAATAFDFGCAGTSSTVKMEAPKSPRILAPRKAITSPTKNESSMMIGMAFSPAVSITLTTDTQRTFRGWASWRNSVAIARPRNPKVYDASLPASTIA